MDCAKGKIMLELILMGVAVVLVATGYILHRRREQQISQQFAVTGFLGCLIVCFYIFGILSFIVSIVSSIIRAHF